MAALSRERLSRGLFILPTLFTVGNLFCGYLSIWSSIRGTGIRRFLSSGPVQAHAAGRQRRR